jgi:hypothetical protein
MVITKKNILDIIKDNNRYGLSTVSLTFLAGTIITRAALEAARGRIVLNVKKPQKPEESKPKNPGMSVEDFLKARASIAGAAGTGDSKKRGGPRYYSKLSKRRHKMIFNINEFSQRGREESMV